MTLDLDNIKLTEWTTCGGCAAKWAGVSLEAIVGQLAREADDSLLVGLAPFDDAAIYRISEHQALVSTTDFFPPLVDDPGDFGAIAAANACSDVFAMGGDVILALNIAAFPESLPERAIGEIMQAASAIVREAGGVIAGGHTIRSEEPIFGLAVQGLIDPCRILTKGGAKVGDVVVLSKPIGTGIVLAGGTDGEKKKAIAGMRRLNKDSSLVLRALGDAVHAATDVTGFGLVGHAWEMAEHSRVAINLEGALIPFYEGALEASERGVRTGGDLRNREHLRGRVVSRTTPALEGLAFDPQTSGGLLAAIDEDAVGQAVDQGFTVVGSVSDAPASITIH